MSQSINYDLAKDALHKLNTDDTISSAHGLLCGFFCVKQDIHLDDWLNELLVSIDLNNLLEKEMFKEIDYMKIDTQGSELEILKGSTNFLDGIIGLEVEVEFVEIYKGQPLFPEVNEFIQSHGFSLIDMKRTFWKRRVRDAGDGKGQIIFADVLYFKQPEQVLKLIGLNKELSLIHI